MDGAKDQDGKQKGRDNILQSKLARVLHSLEYAIFLCHSDYPTKFWLSKHVMLLDMRIF